MISTLSLWFLIAGYGVMITFFIIQRLLRKSSSAKSLRGGRYDRGNMALIGSATGIGLWLPIIFDALGIETFRINFLAGFVALAVMVCGVVSGYGQLEL